MKPGFARILSTLAIVALAATPDAWAGTPPPSGPAFVRRVPQAAGVDEVRAVALSHDAQYLASIVVRHGRNELMVSGWNGSQRKPVAIPGSCPVVEIRWAPREQWHELAVLTRCMAEGDSPLHGAIWTITFGTLTRQLRKVADIPGFATDIEWTPTLKHIAFLYVPGATNLLETKRFDARLYGSFGDNGVRYGPREQQIGIVPVAGGEPAILTPADFYVYAFRIAPVGHQIAYTASSPPAGAEASVAKLYVQDTRVGATPRTIVDPATVGGPLHGLRIGLIRWWPTATQIFFIGGTMSNIGAIGGDIYAVPFSGGRPVDLIAGGNATSFWFRFLGPGSLFVTQVAEGRVQAVEYDYRATFARRAEGWFSVPYGITDGRHPLAVSIGGPHMAFISGLANRHPATSTD